MGLREFFGFAPKRRKPVREPYLNRPAQRYADGGEVSTSAAMNAATAAIVDTDIGTTHHDNTPSTTHHTPTTTHHTPTDTGGAHHGGGGGGYDGGGGGGFSGGSDGGAGGF